MVVNRPELSQVIHPNTSALTQGSLRLQISHSWMNVFILFIALDKFEFLVNYRERTSEDFFLAIMQLLPHVIFFVVVVVEAWSRCPILHAVYVNGHILHSVG